MEEYTEKIFGLAGLNIADMSNVALLQPFVNEFKEGTELVFQIENLELNIELDDENLSLNFIVEPLPGTTISQFAGKNRNSNLS